jgi:hypothetical protein
MLGDMRRCRVYQALDIMDLNTAVDDLGVIHVDDGKWKIFLPETNTDRIVVSFEPNVEPWYSADSIVRFTCFLQIAGFTVSVLKNQQEVELSESDETIH